MEHAVERYRSTHGTEGFEEILQMVELNIASFQDEGAKTLRDCCEPAASCSGDASPPQSTSMSTLGAPLTSGMTCPDANE